MSVAEVPCCSLQTDLSPPECRRWRRIHGLQLPLHPQQVLGWILLMCLASSTFVLLLPALSAAVRAALQPAMGLLFGIHLVSHLVALLLDPAEPELRQIPHRRYPVPEFDRSKHAHVIEDGRCHLCNIAVTGLSTKHCSACNKCVANFDHHCKWLNHCVGGRNYLAFLVCVASAGLASLAIAAISLTELAVFYAAPQYLPSDESPVPLLLRDTLVFQIITSALTALALTTAALLLHLLIFHIYIAVHGITTYEYIRNYRYYSENKPPSRCFDQHTSRVSPENFLHISQHKKRKRILCCWGRKTRVEPSVPQLATSTSPVQTQLDVYTV